MIFVNTFNFCIAIILYWRYSNRWYNPLFIYWFFWSLIIFFSSLNLFNLFNVGMDTYLLFELGLIGFLLGFVINQYKFKRRQVTVSKEKTVTYTFNRPFLIILIIIVGAILLVKSLDSIRSLLSGVSVTDFRYSVYEYSPKDSTSKYNFYLLTFFLTPIISVLGVVLSLEIFFGKRDKFLIISIFILTILYIIVSGGGRACLMSLVFNFFFLLIISKRKFNLSKKRKRQIIWFSVFCIVIFLGVNSFRGKDNALIGLLKETYVYYTGSIRHFVIRINRLGDTRSYGAAFFGGYLRFIFLVLGIFGISAPTMYNTFLYQNSFLQSGVQIGKGVWYNAFVSLNYHFYLDFGAVGIFFGNLLFGTFSALIFKRFLRNRNFLNMGMLLLVLQCILFSMVRWQFSFPPYAFAFLYLRMILKKESKETILTK